MKKLLVIIAALTFLAACDKEDPEFCWRFDKTYTTTQTNGEKTVTYDSIIKCDLTEGEAEGLRLALQTRVEYNGVVIVCEVKKTKVAGPEE